MPFDLDSSTGRKISFGVHEHEQEAKLASKDVIECMLDGWTEQDLAEAASWTHLTIKGRRYKLLSPIRATGPFRIQLDE